ncbi:MAG: EAL domain-containing protein [Eubacterium sp.]|nr:EAL domain-containing protein [Eubacterium sp.]
MIPIHFVFYSDLDQRTEQAFRDLTLSSEYSDLSYSIRHGGDLAAPVGRTPVLVTGDPIRLKKANELNFRTVFCAEADQLADCSFDVLWPAEETVVEREAHFRQLLHLLMMEHLAWEYEMLLDVTIDTVPDLIWYKRLDGIHMKVNDTFAKTVQKDKSDIRGKDHYYIWNAPRPAEGGTLGRDCSTSEEMTIRSGKTCSFEEELETREGIKQLVTYKTPVYDSFGKVYGTVGLGHDVTNIRNLGNELSILVENIPLPMFAATTDWVAVRMNSAFMELSGTDNSEMEAFDYKKWKEECLLPSSEAVVDRERHIVKQEFSWTGDGETKIFLVMEQEVRDHFDHISGYFCLLEDVTLQRMHLQEMDQMVTTDVLTGLYNRRFFYSYLTEQADKLWTLLYMDLDGFKGVNDTFGHHFGDKTLIRVADLLRELFPQSKSIRLGGDEFAVLLESEMQEGVIQSKIHELEERVEGLIPEKPGLLSISVGVVARRGEIKDMDAFIHEGDSRMYEIKRKHHAEREARKPAAPGDGDDMVQLRYMKGFRNAFIEMEGQPWNEGKADNVMTRTLCSMLRIARIEVMNFANPEEEHAGTGRVTEIFRDGKADPKRFIDRRNVTHGYNIIFIRAFQKEGEPDWNDNEREGVDLVLRMIFVMDGRQKLMHIAERLSYLDQEMDIHNHRYYMLSLGRLHQQNLISNYVAIFLNLKRFSVINLTLGRALGTKVMQRYVKAIEGSLIGDEMICRVGGDNYALLVEKDRAEDIMDMALEMMVVYDDETGDRIRINSTMGVYVIPEDGSMSTPPEIMDRISRVGLQAKRSMDESVIYFDAFMMSKRARELDIEANFHDSLKNEEFEVYYQPKVDLETYTMTGAEALCRWNHAGQTFPPEGFVPLLEQTMEICALDMYVLEHVCCDIRKWLDEGRRVPRISVNLSRRNLADVDLLRHILEIVDRNNVPHEYLEIELTETTTDVQFSDLKRVVMGLQKTGIRTAVDDFGIGYSSLTLIRDIPWDVLKIDRSFLPVQGDEQEFQKNLMFRYVVAMAQSMGLRCVVEGIETPDQLRLVQQNGCDEVQGFFFDRPLRRDEFVRRMERTDYAKLAGAAGVW